MTRFSLFSGFAGQRISGLQPLHDDVDQRSAADGSGRSPHLLATGAAVGKTALQGNSAICSGGYSTSLRDVTSRHERRLFAVSGRRLPSGDLRP